MTQNNLSDFGTSEIEISTFQEPILDDNNNVTVGEYIAYHSSVWGFIKNDSIYLESLSGCCGNSSTDKLEGIKIQ